MAPTPEQEAPELARMPAGLLAAGMGPVVRMSGWPLPVVAVRRLLVARRVLAVARAAAALVLGVVR